MVPQPAGARMTPDAAADVDADRPALGAQGVARSTLRPAGTAEFEGRLVDVVSDGQFIEAGETIEVTGVEGDRVTVAPVRSA